MNIGHIFFKEILTIISSILQSLLKREAWDRKSNNFVFLLLPLSQDIIVLAVAYSLRQPLRKTSFILVLL